MEWIDVKFSDFLKERKGRYKPNDESIKGLKRIEKIDFSGQIYLSDKPSKTDMILVKDGDLVISGINVEKGAMNIFHGNDDVVATIHYSSYTYDTDIIDLEFLKHFLKSKKFKDVLKEQVQGGIKTEIKPKHLLPLEIQIPKSLDDQRNVVNHLDELYESLNNLSNDITHQLDLIKNLRQVFLREAMQGLLVSNETSNNKTGADLLADIQAEKVQLVKDKKIKKPKTLAPITEEEIPFAIPENWTWCRLDEITKLVTDGKHGDCRNSENSGFYFISAKDLKNRKFDYTNARQILQEDFQETHNRTNLEPYDLCIVNTGATIGKSVIAPEDEKTYKTTFQKSVAIVKPLIVNVFFIEYLVISQTDKLLKKSRGSAINNLLISDLKNFIIPLPSLEIQERIVAKLDELMGYCDALEEQVKQSQQTNDLLLQQVLREALGA